MSVIESTKQFAPAGTWTADPVHSNVSFEVAYAGVNTFRGGFREFTATLDGRRARGLGQGRVRRRQGRAAERPPADARLLRRRALSRRSPSRRPSSRRGDDDTVTGKGELTIKGVTQPIELTGTIAPAPSTDPFGRERLGLRLETTIDRTQYGVSWNAPNQSGGDYLAQRREAHRRARVREGRRR